MMESGILQLQRLALITLTLPHMSAPAELLHFWCCCSVLVQLDYASASLGLLVYQHTHQDDKA